MKKMKNIVYTVDEYMTQGFTKTEAYVMRKADKMFNNWDYLTDKEKEKYYLMAKRLGLWIPIFFVQWQKYYNILLQDERKNSIIFYIFIKNITIFLIYTRLKKIKKTIDFINDM